MYENVLAKMVIDAVPSVEMVRFTNSGEQQQEHSTPQMPNHTEADALCVLG